jgi:hypothetical protein
MAAYLGSDANTATRRAEQKAAMAARFGRSTDKSEPYMEGTSLVLPILSKGKALELLKRHAEAYGSDPTPPTRVTSELASMTASVAARAVRGDR